jgi:hypothetical protein
MFVASRNTALTGATMVLSLMAAGVATSFDPLYLGWTPANRLEATAKRFIDFCHSVRTRWAHRIILGTIVAIAILVFALTVFSVVFM